MIFELGNWALRMYLTFYIYKGSGGLATSANPSFIDYHILRPLLYLFTLESKYIWSYASLARCPNCTTP